MGLNDVTFTKLPLELRQRVYDFYLIAFNTEGRQTPGNKRRKWQGNLSQYYQPVVARHHHAHRITLPLLQTGLGSEVKTYFLAHKLAVDLDALAEFLQWTRMIPKSDVAKIGKVEVKSAISMRYKGNMSKYCSPSGPIVMIQLRNNGKRLEVKSKVRLGYVYAIQFAVQWFGSVAKRSGRSRFDGSDIVNILQKAARTNWDAFSCHVPNKDLSLKAKTAPGNLKGVLAELEKKWTYEYLVASFDLA